MIDGAKMSAIAQPTIVKKPCRSKFAKGTPLSGENVLSVKLHDQGRDR